MTTTAGPSFFKKYRSLVVAGCVALVLALIAIFSFWSWHNGISNEGREQQQDIVALESFVEIEISGCLDRGATTGKIVKAQYEAVKGILVDVAAARYVGVNESPTRANDALGGGAFISALREQNPDVDVASWQNFIAIVNGCRQDVGDAQRHIQTKAANFRTWVQTGGVFENQVRSNFPNGQLETKDRLTGQMLYGKAALDYLTRVISVQAAKDAMTSGTAPDQDFDLEPKPEPKPEPAPR